MENYNLVNLKIDYVIYGVHFSNRFTVCENDVSLILDEVIVLLNQYHCEDFRAIQSFVTEMKDNRIDTIDSIKDYLITNLEAMNDNKTALRLTIN